MKRVYQTDTSKERGNCVQACIASIFNLTLTQVPNFTNLNPKNNISEMIKWVVGEGYSIIILKDLYDGTSGTMCLATIRSKRHPTAHHMVVGRLNFDGDVVLLHDPDTSGKNKIGQEIEWVKLYFIFRGSRYLHKLDR